MLFGRVSALLFLLLLLAAIVLADRTKPYPSQPQTTCVVDTRGYVRDVYTIRGRNWNVTEAQVKNAINSPGTVLTAWEWMSALDEDNARVFKAEFKMPINEEKSLKKRLAELVEPFPFDVKCWKPSDGGGTNDLPPNDKVDFLTGKWPRYNNGGFRKRL